MSAPRPSIARTSSLVLAVVVSLGATSCNDGLPTSSDQDPGGATPLDDMATVLPPPERSTPFCAAMTALTDRLENDPPPDVGAAIVEVYRSVVDDVPDAIRADFLAVLADLEGGADGDVDGAADGGADGEVKVEVVATTVETALVAPSEVPSSMPDPVVDQPAPDDPLSDEGFSPDETPAGRVSAYVGFVCRGVVNNPGPPDTQPLID